MRNDSIVEERKTSDYVVENEGSEDEGKNQINEDQLRVMNARQRVNKWVNEHLDSNQIIEGLRNGIATNKKHNFRNVKKEKHLSKMPFLNRK